MKIIFPRVAHEFNKMLSLTIPQDMILVQNNTLLLYLLNWKFRTAGFVCTECSMLCFWIKHSLKKVIKSFTCSECQGQLGAERISALMSLPGLKKQFNSARDLFMNVKSPTAFEEQPLAPESLNSHQRRQHTRGVGAVRSNCHNCPQSKTNGSFSSPLIPRD